MKDMPNEQAGDEAWRDWMLERLERISKEHGDAHYQVLLGMADQKIVDQKPNYALAQTIKALKQRFPVAPTSMPSGAVWQGSRLPAGILEASLENNDSIERQLYGHALNMAAALESTPVGLLKWLMASGFDPIGFNPHTQNTPLGNSAYKGRLKLLRLIRQGGFDLSLRLEEHHLEDKGKEAGLIGTTLLHRMAIRWPRMQPETAKAVLLELLKGGLDPLEENANGHSALYVARGGAREVLEQWIAGGQLASMEANTPRRRAGRRGQRL